MSKPSPELPADAEIENIKLLRRALSAFVIQCTTTDRPGDVPLYRMYPGIKRAVDEARDVMRMTKP